ncbi:MAG: hypothetical protein AB7K09_05680 [Planctomycetota bacterium]
MPPTTAITIRGIVKPDGSLELEEHARLPVGPVEVVVRAVSPPPDEGWWPYLQRVVADRSARGQSGMTDAEIDAHIAWLRQDDDDRIERARGEQGSR